MKLLIAGDTVPNELNQQCFVGSDIQNLLQGKLLKIWNAAEMRTLNLETPITKNDKKITKQGPNFKANPDTINGIYSLRPSIVALANNHIMDYSEKGLRDTIQALNSNNLEHIGAGESLTETNHSKIIEYDGFKIGFYNCAEHEFSIATENSPGANPYDPLESFDHVEALKKQSDYVVVLFHGGKEYYRYPSPNLQRIARKMVEKGANLFVAQHSHCVGSYEEYLGGTIVYGQGNFLFNKEDKYKNPYWNNGILIEVDLQRDAGQLNEDITFVPYVTQNKGIRLANDEEKSNILNPFFERSQQIKHAAFVHEQYQKFADAHLYTYLSKLSGFGKIFNKIDRKLFNHRVTKLTYGRNKRLAMQNYIECEAHRELLIQGLKNKNKN